jgi:uncharacterized membrane protein
MDALLGIFGAFGLSASAGLNAYIPLLVIGVIAHYTPWIKLTPPFDLLANPWILILLGILLIIEMLADKLPAVNHLNDLIQTGIRPLAGAIAFAASAHVITNINPLLALACGLLVAGSIHTVKAVAVRPAVTATTAGVGNVPISLLEDVTATIVSVASVVLPVLGVILLVILILGIVWFFHRRAARRKRAASKA